MTRLSREELRDALAAIDGESLHALLMTWFDHELREQLKMDPHQVLKDSAIVAAQAEARKE